MLKKDRWRLAIVIVVVVAALLSVFPLDGKINLGLDLKGGAHIVLQAKPTSGSALTDDSIERLLAVLRNRGDQKQRHSFQSVALPLKYPHPLCHSPR
jgi:preprotein translocase subunit SecD